MHKKQLKLTDIGYYGKPIDTLSKKELHNAFLELAQQLYDNDLMSKPCDSKYFENKK